MTNDSSLVLPTSNADSKCATDSSFRNKICCALISVVLFLAIIILPLSLKKVGSTEFGISYTKYSKQLDDAARSGGLYTGPPGFKFIKFPSLYITADLPESTCVSKDGLRVNYDVTFQYRMEERDLKPAILKYRNFENWARIVEVAGNSAVQHACSLFEVSNFQNKRGVIQSTMEDYLRIKLEGVEGSSDDVGVYATALSLQLRNVDLPSEYREAVSEKQQAAEDITLAKNQRLQLTTKARTQLLSAREEAKKINDTAINEAEVLLTEAALKAEEIEISYRTEAEVIRGVKEDLGLTSEGVLAYMTTRMYSEAEGLEIVAGEPARLGRQNEL